MRPLGGGGRGLTLVEIVVAAGVLLILLLGLFATLGQSGKVESYTHEHQAASEAVFRQLDLVTSTPLLDDIQRAGGGDVPAYAFHVDYKGINLKPATDAFVPKNLPPNETMVGHVRVIEVDVDGDSNPDDYDGDGNADLLEIQVIVAWKSPALGGQDARVEAVTQVTR